MALARVSSSSPSPRLLPSSVTSPLLHSFLRLFSSILPARRAHPRRFPVAAAFSQASPSFPSAKEEGEGMEAPRPSSRHPWKPTCLYYTQGKCTMMNDTGCREFGLRTGDGREAQPGKEPRSRFVRPTAMCEQRIREYIEGKYGKFGVDRVWHDTATPFKEVLQEFEDWIGEHNLWKKEQGGSLNGAAFVTCGNWDLKTKVPEQCRVSKIKLPSYFMEWINLKDIYLNFYKRRLTKLYIDLLELIFDCS